MRIPDVRRGMYHRGCLLCFPRAKYLLTGAIREKLAETPMSFTAGLSVLQGIVAFFAGSNPDGLFQVLDENLAIANSPGRR